MIVEMPERAEPRFASGLLMLADISGYTAFMGRVTEAHPDLATGLAPVPPAYDFMVTLLDLVADEMQPTFRRWRRSSSQRVKRPSTRSRDLILIWMALRPVLSWHRANRPRTAARSSRFTLLLYLKHRRSAVLARAQKPAQGGSTKSSWQ